MRYELLGIGPDGDTIEFQKAYPSRKQAVDAVDGMDDFRLPYFMVLETPTRTAVPLGYYAGRTRAGIATLARATYVQVGGALSRADIFDPDHTVKLVDRL